MGASMFEVLGGPEAWRAVLPPVVWDWTSSFRGRLASTSAVLPTSSWGRFNSGILNEPSAKFSKNMYIVCTKHSTDADAGYCAIVKDSIHNKT